MSSPLRKNQEIFLKNIFSFRIFPSYSGPVTVLILRVRVVQGPFLLSYLDGRQHRGPEATIKLPSGVLPLICGFESSRCCLSSPFRKNPEIFFKNISSFRIFLSYSGPVAVLILCIRAVQGPFPLSYLDDQHRTPEGTIKLPSEILPLICGFESS